MEESKPSEEATKRPHDEEPLSRSVLPDIELKKPKLLEEFMVYQTPQLDLEDIQSAHQFHANLPSEELHEYQTSMAQMAAEVSSNVFHMEQHKNPWSKSDAHWVIPGPWKTDRAFYFCLRTGEAIFAQSDDVLTEAEIYEHWDQVEESDKLESRSFIDHKCFRATHTNNATNGNVIDGTWVRRWKKMYDENNKVYYIIKSRMCGRGFLDSQKHNVMRHSSTASRLSQRIISSLYATEQDMVMEVWDISTAFLRGLSYKELQDKARQLGIELKEAREVYLHPPKNLWRHFRQYPKSNIRIDPSMTMFFLLLLLKPIYGLVDAPLLWQLALALFIRCNLGGIQSVFDDNFFIWSDTRIHMVWTIHVDDIIVLATSAFIKWALHEMQERFGTIKRHTLPFTHMGMTYTLLAPYHLFIHQDQYLSSLEKVNIDKRLSPDQACDATLTTAFRSLLCSLLWLCQTREDIYCETVQLQQATKNPLVSHVKQTNALLDKALRNRHQAGLHFPPLNKPLRVLSVGDASHGNKLTSYPQEGTASLLGEDHLDEITTDHDDNIHTKYNHLIGGKTHTLMLASCKSKRISHSTCTGETNAGYRTNINSQFVAIRYTEIINTTKHQHTAKDMLKVYNDSMLQLRIDHHTDCLDFWQLVCGTKGVPSDKSSRLAVLSFREERLSGRIRGFLHIPTEIMLVDALTKIGIFPLIMHHLTTGTWQTTAVPKGKAAKLRVITDTKQDFDESDLVDLKY